MKSLILLCLISTQVLAANFQCEDFAKSEAAKSYKKDLGPIKGTGSFRATSEVMRDGETQVDYLVTLTDANKDQSAWDINYIIRVAVNGDQCTLIEVRKGLINPPEDAPVFRAQVDQTYCGQLDPFTIGEACIVFVTKTDGVKLGIVLNRVTEDEIFTCPIVTINANALSPIRHKAVINSLRSHDPTYHYMYGTYFNEIFRRIN